MGLWGKFFDCELLGHYCLWRHQLERRQHTSQPTKLNETLLFDYHGNLLGTSIIIKEPSTSRATEVN